jgi:hypothetical protein
LFELRRRLDLVPSTPDDVEPTLERKRKTRSSSSSSSPSIFLQKTTASSLLQESQATRRETGLEAHGRDGFLKVFSSVPGFGRGEETLP